MVTELTERPRASLDEVTEVAEYVANHSVTIGVGLEHCQ